MPEPDRYQLWRMPEVIRRTGVCQTTIYNMMAAGKFPRPRQVGGSVAWWAYELIEWMEGLPQAGLLRDSAAPDQQH